MNPMTTTTSAGEKVLYRNGSVHSPADPFATALLVQGGQIQWVGEEAGADSLVDPQVREVDLEGLVLTPGFSGLVTEQPEDAEWGVLLRAGWTQLVLPQAEGGLALLLADGRRALREVPLVRTGQHLPDSHQVVLEAAPDTTAWIEAARSAWAEGDVLALVRECWTASAASVSAGNPWALCWDGLAPGSDEQGLAVRATFQAQTRSVHRIFGTGGPLSGQLAPGSPATFVGWRAESLMVQTADSRIAAWSTDPRARTPLLPALEAQRPLPEAVLTVLEGRPCSAAGSC